MKKENEVIDNEERLKKVLDEFGFRYGDRFSTVGYILSFLEKSSGAEIYQIACSSPINGLRILPSLLEQKKLGGDDINTIIEFAYDLKSRDCKSINVQISPYIYFKKQEISVQPAEKTE